VSCTAGKRGQSSSALVVPGGSSKLAKIQPRETGVAIPADSSISAHSWSHATATVHSASQPPPYLLLASASIGNSSNIVRQPSSVVLAISPGNSVGNSNIICQPPTPVVGNSMGKLVGSTCVICQSVGLKSLVNVTFTTAATAQRNPPTYLVVSNSIGNSVGNFNVISQSAALKSPTGNFDKTTVAAGTAMMQRSQASYVILGNFLGNSVGNSAGGFQLMLPSAVSGTPKSSTVPVLSNSVVLVNHSSASSTSLASFVETCLGNFVSNLAGSHRLISLRGSHMSSAVPVLSKSVVLVNSSSALPSSVSSVAAASAPFLTMSGSGSGLDLVLHTAGVQSSTLLSPTTSSVDQNASKLSSSVQYLLPAPVMQPISLQSPTNSQSNLPQSSSALNTTLPVGNLQASPVWPSSSVESTKLAVVGLSSASSLSVGNSKMILVQSPLGGQPLLVGNSSLSGIAGIQASAAVEPPLLGNSQPGVAQQSLMYYVVLGNSQSSGVQMSPLSLLGQTAGMQSQQPQLMQSSPASVITSQ